MKARLVYLIIAIVGVILPYSQMIPWSMSPDASLASFWADVTANRLSVFGWLDAGVSGLALFAFIAFDRAKSGVRAWWWPVLGTLAVGVSFGFPLYLWMRERAADRSGATTE